MKVRIIFYLIFTTALLFTFACEEKKEIRDSAEMVIVNGVIETVDDEYGTAEAISIKADTIYRVGTTKEISELISDSTTVIDLNGAMAIPGFIDSHAHFWGIGQQNMDIDLRDAETWNDIIFMAARKAETMAPGAWIIGRGWHQEKWSPPPRPDVEGYPYHDLLSSATPNNPVLLTHGSGHAIIANEKAMKLAGIDDSTKAPEGGRIVRDSKGKAIGVFEEEAETLIWEAYNLYRDKMTPVEKKNELIEIARLADEECLRKGITTMHDAGSTFSDIDLLVQLYDEGMLGLRLYAMIYEPNERLKENISNYYISGYAGNHLTVRAVKRYIDGALGSRGALMFEPYNDLPDYKGLMVNTLEYLEEAAEIAYKNGFQLCTHAIGDSANYEMLNIYSKYSKKPDLNLRWRIEHAQHLRKEDIPRFAKHKIIASMQTNHATSDGIFVVKRLGEERAEEGAYVWRKLINSGAMICNGTDAPVENVDPVLNFYSAVTRNMANGEAFYPAQKMTRREALESYTINGAYAAFEEKIKGSITPGKLADITILSKNIMTIPEEEIKETKVLYTIVGGKIKYRYVEEEKETGN